MILLQRVLIDQTAKSQLLRYAKGYMLDYLGDFTNTPRLAASYATTRLYFTLSTELASAQVIPAGTRVSPDGAEGEIYFATNTTIVIPPGQLTGFVAARCLTAGEIGNDFDLDTIDTLIDPIPFVEFVGNTTISAGGADEEEDEPYKERIRLSNDSYSTAGPVDGYIYWAKTASAAIVDVAAISPAPTEVTIIPLLENGELPTQEILDLVAAALSPRNRRPLTDKVTVQRPDIVDYEINVTYFVHEDNIANLASIQAAVNQAVADYAVWQKSKLGRDINPSELVKRMLQAGADRVDQPTMLPEYKILTDLQVAREAEPVVIFGGLSK
ncbi:baseplate J/gp47 family protein [Paenibacillus pabuli]|uniref:baseplate J/gp47 family protein n=1 Tax=Paenibacillus pabuli TaxID=1472 RepID=UPI001FFF8685|nr:baseplate J/gp47 family protein [Paenibacillus pabuli]UPK45902.1 baseplate J/gp47 family protein [Paenibacillus pabuli]